MNYKLSKILDAQEKLNNIGRNNLSIELLSNLEEIINIITEFDLVDSSKVKQDFASIKYQLSEINIAIDKLHQITDEFSNKLEFERAISHQSLLKEINNKPWYLYWSEDEDNDYLNHRMCWPTTPYIIEKVVSLIGKYIDWRFPVLYLEPHTAELMRYLVSGDPFYIVDDRTEPYKKLLKDFADGANNRIHHYKKSDVEKLELNSIGMCVSWRNFQFKKLGEVRKDIELMSKLTIPGGYVVFEYVDAAESHTAEAIERGNFTFQWRDRILQFLQENNLEILHEIKFPDHSPILMFCKKLGKIPDLTLTNKVGLVLRDREYMMEIQKIEEQTKEFYREIIKRLLLQVATSDIINKVEICDAIGELESFLSRYASSHIEVLGSILRVSKLVYNIGKISDSHNLVNRAKRDIEKIQPNQRLYKNFHEWLDFLNNT